MNRASAISRIKQGLGFRTDLDSEIISALQEAQMEFEKGESLPWFLIERDQTISVVTGTTNYALGTGFLKFVEDEPLRFTDISLTSYQFLTKRPHAEAVKYYAEYDESAPLSYVLRSNNTIDIYPTPDSSYSLTYSYYKAGETLDNDVENVWLVNNPYYLIGKAGLIVAMDLENKSSIEKFKFMHDTWKAWQLREMAAREEQNMPRAMGRNL